MTGVEERGGNSRLTRQAMTELKGDRLYVNLSASQVRRRLKGFGHGVRKIQSAGKNRAVTVHTATGQHLHELEAVFNDVMKSLADEETGKDGEKT